MISDPNDWSVEEMRVYIGFWLFKDEEEALDGWGGVQKRNVKNTGKYLEIEQRYHDKMDIN